MFDMSQDNLQGVLQQLDQAIYNHEQWHKELTRTLICRLPFDQRDVQREAHRHCRFGQWYYVRGRDMLQGHPAFSAIEESHKRMHQIAAGLLQGSTVKPSLDSHDYDLFVNALDRLRLQIFTLKRELEEALSYRDHLTGAEGRIGMLTKLREIQELVKRRVQQCSVAIMDLDHFKGVNDTFGHPVGDVVLATLVKYVIAHLRRYDRIFRYGGEEFLICMQYADAAAGLETVERLREGVSSIAAAHSAAGKANSITASFGIALIEPEISVEEAIDRADKAMYAAKAAGRNCTRIWDPSMQEMSG